MATITTPIARIKVWKRPNTVCMFFNNDIIVSPNWDVRIFDILEKNENLKILSVATNDHLESKAVLKKYPGGGRGLNILYKQSWGIVNFH